MTIGGGAAVLCHLLCQTPADTNFKNRGTTFLIDGMPGAWETQATGGNKTPASSSASLPVFADTGAAQWLVPRTPLFFWPSSIPAAPLPAASLPVSSVLRKIIETSSGASFLGKTFAPAGGNGETYRQASAAADPVRDAFMVRNTPEPTTQGLVTSLPPDLFLLVRPWEKRQRGTESGEGEAESLRATQTTPRPHFAVTRALQPVTWNGSSTDWGVGGNWSNGMVPGTANTATFTSTGSPTVSLLSAPQVIGGLNFTASAQAFTINGSYSLTIGSEGITQNSATNRQTISTTGGVILGANHTWNVAAGGMTVSSPISGGFGLTKTGTGELTLASMNSFSGGTSVTAGTLTFAATGSGGNGGLVVSNPGTGVDDIGGSDGAAVTINVATTNAFSNQTAFALQGGNGSNAYSIGGEGSPNRGRGNPGGSLTVNLSAANALGQNLTQLSLSGGDGGDARIVSIMTIGSLQSGGAGGSVTLNLLTANALSAQTNLILARGTDGASATRAGRTVSGGAGSGVTVNLNGISQRIGGINSAMATNLIVQNNSANNATLAVGDSASHSYGGILRNGTGGGTLALVKAGSGTLTLTGNNTYSGGTLVEAGTVVARGTGLGTGKVTVAQNATLSVGSAVNTTTNSQATGTLTLTSLVLTPDSAVPQLTFNLGADGVSDMLILTGGGGALTASSAGVFLFGFASAGGDPLPVSGTYHLLTFTTPQSVNALPGLAQYQAVGVGNVSSLRLGDAFTYQMMNGQITGLDYTLGRVAIPEPSPLLLMAGIVLSGTILLAGSRYPILLLVKSREGCDTRLSKQKPALY